MVDFKLLLNPPISGKVDILRRRCVQERNICSNFGRCKILSTCSTDRKPLVDEEGNYEPRFKKRYIVGAAVVVVVIILIILAYCTNIFSREKIESELEEDSTKLVPPNPIKNLPPSASTLHVFKKAAVCADGPPCAEIGKNILEKNGSAVDATIATMFCNGIVTMQSMGLGGGFLMTIYIREEQKAYSLNAREKAPNAATNDLYRSDEKSSQSGPLAIAVPGELKGYWEAHKRFGKLPWEDLVQPAIDICEKGYNISDHQHNAFTKNNNDLRNDSNLKEWFDDGTGNFKKIGSKVIPTKLCQTLKLIAKNGGDDLYNGTLAKTFVEDIKEIGGIITAEDLQNYNVEWQDPISVTFRNQDRLFSPPPPGSGALLSFIMNILDGYGFDKNSIDGINNTVLTYHRIIEAFKYAYARRTELGDLNFNNITSLLKNLTSAEYANDIRLKINDYSTSQKPEDYGAVFFGTEDHGTAHISVLAENGDAVSVTSSVNIYFGAGLTSKRTGIIFGSSMNDFSFPFYKSYFGLPGSPNNKMEPGKRPLSSMAPTIITNKQGDVKLVLGASGGTKITSTVAQVIMRVLWFGENLKEAVDAPRIHHQLFPMQVDYEYGTLQQIVDGLKALGHKLKRNSGSIICALYKEANKIIGNADYRKKGEVFGIS